MRHVRPSEWSSLSFGLLLAAMARLRAARRASRPGADQRQASSPWTTRSPRRRPSRCGRHHRRRRDRRGHQALHRQHAPQVIDLAGRLATPGPHRQPPALHRDRPQPARARPDERHQLGRDRRDGGRGREDRQARCAHQRPRLAPGEVEPRARAERRGVPGARRAQQGVARQPGRLLRTRAATRRLPTRRRWRLAGITRKTPNPPGGEIAQGQAGEPDRSLQARRPRGLLSAGLAKLPPADARGTRGDGAEGDRARRRGVPQERHHQRARRRRRVWRPSTATRR